MSARLSTQVPSLGDVVGNGSGLTLAESSQPSLSANRGTSKCVVVSRSKTVSTEMRQDLGLSLDTSQI